MEARTRFKWIAAWKPPLHSRECPTKYSVRWNTIIVGYTVESRIGHKCALRPLDIGQRFHNVLRRTGSLTCHTTLYAITYQLFQFPGGTYALNFQISLKDGAWEASQPFAISESFRLEDNSTLSFHLLPADVRSAIHLCVTALNGEINGQPHLTKWAFKEAYRIRENNRYGFIAECLVTKRAVLQHRAQTGARSISAP